MNHLRILTVILGFFAFLTSSINLFGIAWDPPVTLSSTISIKPQIAISPFGYAVAIWQEFDGTNTNIQAATIVRYMVQPRNYFFGAGKYRNNKVIGEILASQPLTFKKCFRSMYIIQELTIVAVSSDGLESSSIPLQIL
jgi:hypothetical protein